VLYREHAAASGIDINVVRESSDGYWSNVWMVKPWSAVYWSGRPTEDWMFSLAYAAGAAWNDSFWEHERFNQILREARAELDENRRAELYTECQRITRDEGGVVIPMFANFVFARNNRLQHDEAMAADWDVDGLRYMERWWFGS
jgi:peptide/nickel transport system substrate-binding protein